MHKGQKDDLNWSCLKKKEWNIPLWATIATLKWRF